MKSFARSSARLLILALILPACSKKDPDVLDLERAASTVEQMVAPLFAPRTSFFVVLPNGSPKQFVSWYFSSMGVAEWAPVDDPSELNKDERDAMRQIGMALRPKDVYYRHSMPDPKVRKQLVLKWDNAEETVILEGYVDPEQPPLISRSFKLPRRVVPNEATRLFVQSNLETGMTYQSF